MLKYRSREKEIMDDLTLSGAALKKNLDEIDLLNKWFGARRVIRLCMESIYKRFQSYCHLNTLTIVDLGCGSGDLMLAVQHWAQSANVDIKLIGIDANMSTIQYAKQKSQHTNIQYKMLDIGSREFCSLKFDIVLISNFCHHFSDAELVSLMHSLKQQTRLSIVINDLHRHWISYYAVKLLTVIFKFSKLSKHDGPLSVKRAFKRKDLQRLMLQSNHYTYDLSWAWAFRWKLIIWC